MIRIGVRKELGSFDLELSLRIAKGSFLALRGSSGSGKTTLLRILAGLESARGAIEVEGEVWLRDDFSLPPQKREIGFVFQDYALFPNMSVLQNLLYVRKDNAFAYHLLEIVDMLSLKDRFPSQLSGGQKQRVALARALMKKPKLLLLDEPLSALDPKMRSELQNKIKELHEIFHTTTIMVSHDIAEIYRLSQRVVTLERGRIVADEATKEIEKGTPLFKGEVVDIVDGKLLVAFLGHLYTVEAKSQKKIGDIVEVEIASLRLFGES